MEISTTPKIKAIANPVSANQSDKYFISLQQRKFYEDNGYLVIKAFLDFESLYTYKQRFVQMCNGVVDKGNTTLVKEPALAKQGLQGERVVNKIQEIHYDDVFITYTEHPKLIHVLSQFIGDDILVVNSMFINKPPGSSAHPPHQDLVYFPFRPADKIMAAWTAVDDVTVDNGCLWLVPRSHRAGRMHEHGHLPGANKLYHGVLDPSAHDPSKWVHLEMGPGDTVLFHPLLVHGSGPNVSQSYRKCVTAHYASAACRYVEARGAHAAVARDVEAEARRRGYSVSFEDTWRFKSKLVSGVRSNL